MYISLTYTRKTSIFLSIIHYFFFSLIYFPSWLMKFREFDTSLDVTTFIEHITLYE